jgi:hypothetical protein
VVGDQVGRWRHERFNHYNIGNTLRCWAIQKTNIASMLNRRSRVDRVAAHLQQTLVFQREIVEPLSGEDMRQRYLRLPIWMTLAFSLYVLLLLIAF